MGKVAASRARFAIRRLSADSERPNICTHLCLNGKRWWRAIALKPTANGCAQNTPGRESLG